MINPRLFKFPIQFTQCFFLFSFFFFLFSLVGCDAFVRKFTRKPKKDNKPQTEMVLAPEEYVAPVMSKEQQYRQSFLFWKSWQDELINTLINKGSQKKQLDCLEEAMKNFSNIKGLLNPQKQKLFDMYFSQLSQLQEGISEDTYGSNFASHARTAEEIKRNILRDLSFQKIRDYLL